LFVAQTMKYKSMIQFTQVSVGFEAYFLAYNEWKAFIAE